MKNLVYGLGLSMALAGAGQAENVTLRMATIDPSLGAALTMSTFANVVSDKLDGVTIEVAPGGAATVHMLELGKANLDLSLTGPNIYNLMAAGKAMYANQPEAPELAKNLALLMWFPWGQYHFAVRDDSGIETLNDIEGTTAYLGPQGGGAYNSTTGWIEATTGLVAGKDYQTIKGTWETGFQAFLDGNVDVYANGCIDPCGQFIRFTATEKARFLGPESHEGEAVDQFLGPWRYRAEIPAGLYENQTNDDPVMSFDLSVGIAVRTDLDADLVYAMTKAFWDNIDQVTSDAPWAKALKLADAPKQLGKIQLHPGAARYYREVGVLN